MENDRDDSVWSDFLAKLERAEEEFVQGRPGAFQSLWSRADDVTLLGAFGGVERGWQNVMSRLSWVSRKYSDGARSRKEISRFVGAEFAYLVQLESIQSRLGSEHTPTRQEFRVTMMFRREPDGWRILHRHADCQAETNAPQ